MRVARVYTNETCNQGCRFCDRRAPRERPSFVRPDAVRERISGALAEGATCVVLTGGEPTRRRDLPALVEHARSGGAQRVELETNGALVDLDCARALADSGLSLARIHLPAWGGDLDRITRDPGGFAATARGLQALAAQGIRLEAAAPVVRDNAALLAGLPELLVESGLPFEALVLGVPVEAPDVEALLPLGRAADLVEEVEAAARRSGLPLRLDPHAPVPPCLFRHPGRLGHLFALTAGGRERAGFRQLEACTGCVLSDRCPGLPVATSKREPALRPSPILEDRVRRRLSLISTVDEQVARELYQDDVHRNPGADTIYSRTVRINFRCNQACDFCFVSTHLPAAEDAAIRGAIVGIARRQGMLILSGGEPTLNPRLVDYVRLGRAEGASAIELQTNAMRLADAELTSALATAGVDSFFVSLHGAEPHVSDAVTNAPGTFAKTVAGIDELHRQGLDVRLSFVFCAMNRTEFPDYVRMVARRWPGAGITASFVAPSTDVVPRTRELIPRYEDVLPHLADGIRIAKELGVRLSGFESMCGIPLCLVPAGISEYFHIADVPDRWDRGEFVAAEACAACDLRSKCFGVRRGYAELHGTGAFRAIRRAQTTG